MDGYVYPGIVSSLALLVCYYTLLRSGIARRRFKIEPPAHTGPEEYERYVRAHQNTIEHLVLFLPLRLHPFENQHNLICVSSHHYDFVSIL